MVTISYTDSAGHLITLQKKIVVVILMLGVVFSLGSYAGLTSLVFPTFERFERETAVQNLWRVRRAIDAELRALDVINREYSEWDHTHQYVLGSRDEYEAENLDISYWVNIDINLMMFFDMRGRLLWSGMLGQSGSTELVISEELLQPITGDHPLLHHRNEPGKTSGILQARTAPLLVSSHPILTSAAKGPSAGTLVVGRFLDSSLVARLGNRASVDIALTSVAGSASRQDFGAKLDLALAGAELTHWEYQENQVTAHHVLKDVFGLPALLLDINTPRSIWEIGQNMIRIALLFFVIATVSILLVAWLFMRNLIVDPIASLTNHILRIKETGDLDRQIDFSRNDELGVLAQNFSDLAGNLSKAQKELESARDQALAKSNAKSEFLARMSHEIRTPMNGVLGMIELLGGTPLSRSQSRYIHSIQESAGTLLGIINDVLDFSKLEAGKFRLENVRFQLNPFLTDITDSLSSLAESKGLRLTCIIPKGPELAVEGDPYRLRQILVNLIGNAIKFTEEGSVVLRVSPEPNGDDYYRLEFEVIDTGIGIEPRKHRQIFDSFTQEDNSTTRRYGGTGLGLSICKQLVEMMGSSIRLRSRPGKGSTFSFELSMKAEAAGNLSDSALRLQQRFFEPYAASGIKPLRGRVLVAEDNAVNQTVVVGMLESMGLDVVIAGDGHEVLDRYSNDSFDVILMDCQMPVMDGDEATREIRNREAAGEMEPVRIIAVTANALPGDMERCLSAGMDDYLSKPFTAGQLHASLTRFLQEDDALAGTGAFSASKTAIEGTLEQADNGVIDFSVLDGLAQLPTAISQNLVEQVIETYLISSRELMARLGGAIDNADPDCVRTTAHALKSSSANVGALELADLFKEIETSTRQSDELHALELLGQVRDEYERVIKALRLRLSAVAA